MGRRASETHTGREERDTHARNSSKTGGKPRDRENPEAEWREARMTRQGKPIIQEKTRKTMNDKQQARLFKLFRLLNSRRRERKVKSPAVQRKF